MIGNKTDVKYLKKINLIKSKFNKNKYLINYTKFTTFALAFKKAAYKSFRLNIL